MIPAWLAWCLATAAVLAFLVFLFMASAMEGVGGEQSLGQSLAEGWWMLAGLFVVFTAGTAGFYWIGRGIWYLFTG